MSIMDCGLFDTRLEEGKCNWDFDFYRRRGSIHWMVIGVGLEMIDVNLYHEYSVLKNERKGVDRET